MKKSRRLAVCAVLSALSVVIMLCAYFPYLTFALPALAGLLMPVAVIEINKKWAFGCFLSTALISLLICEKEAAVLFAFFFGWYPILKSSLERLRSKFVECIIKFAVFNVSIVAAYSILVLLFDFSLESLGFEGKLTLSLFAALGNVVFFVYDIGATRVITLYINKYRDIVRKLIK